MIVRAIKTRKVLPSACTLFELLDESLTDVKERSVIAITSKIVSLCEGATVPLEGTNREELVKREAKRYVVLPQSDYGVIFTVIQDTLIPNAGVDESNAGGVYVLWPRDPQATANAVRVYVCKRFGLKQVGVVITDSTGRPLRWGMGGVSIAHSGFKEVRDYRGEPDLFGREFVHETGAIAGGLAAAAVLVMGEGVESTPLAIVEDVPFVEFQPNDPTAAELDALRVSMENDIFGPMLQAVPWKDGGAGDENYSSTS